VLPFVSSVSLDSLLAVEGHGQGKEAEAKETRKGSMANVQKNRPAILDCTTRQRQTNRAPSGSFYRVCCGHTPWHELSPRGRSSKAAGLRRWLQGLKDEAQWKGSDPWEFLTGDEFGHASQHDYFKA
jgi:hypothetical protein